MRLPHESYAFTRSNLCFYKMRPKYLYFIILSLCTTSLQARTTQGVPRLVVNIAIDQLRSDYIEAFEPLYTGDGLRKLMTGSRWYVSASFPFLPIDRASAIATLATGTTPYYHRIVAEKWMNHGTLRPIYCVDDSQFAGIGTADASSPKNMATSTITDELKMYTQDAAKVFAVAPNRDTAVLSAGHAADGAFWVDDETGLWATSSYYFKNAPAWLSTYNDQYSPAKTVGSVKWIPKNPMANASGLTTRQPLQATFSHNFAGADKYTSYKTSALINENITDMALQCVAANAMGDDDVTDLLAITYYAGSFRHKGVNANPAEMQDTYIGLDKAIEKLISTLERSIGRSHLLFVITGTGYSDEDTHSYQKYRIPTGTFYINRTARLLNMYLGAIYGQGRYVDAYYRNQIYLDRRLMEQKRIGYTELLLRSREFLMQSEGVRDVFTGERLFASGNKYVEKIRGGYNSSVSGDILLEIAPGWKVLNEETQDSYVAKDGIVSFPVIFYGGNIMAERVSTPITVDRIAPTVAGIIRIRAPNACKEEPLF